MTERNPHPHGARVRAALAVIAFAAAGCGGKSTTSTTPDGTTTGDGSASQPAVLTKRMSLSWGAVPVTVTEGGQEVAFADIYLAITDETGKTVSNNLGRYKGACNAFAPAPEMKALTGMRCSTGAGGTELHVVQQGGDELIVLHVSWREGQTTDPMAREQVNRFKVPLGVAITVEPIVSTTGAPRAPE